ncbi:MULTISPECIES: hypothetical protein [Xenorhabdus]|uniref:hypothetical protein n=1 Tax=Xenorhabdus TaxID=626 RepID=UPI0006480441|nr:MULTISPECIES: hypothetical protein [Xenorhabdus]
MLIELHKEHLSSVTKQSSQYCVPDLVKELLSSVDWKVWAGIQKELPDMAELVPEIFFRCLYQAIDSQQSPIAKLFEQERSTGIIRTNYLTGIIWAFEVLAWEPNSLQRVVIALAKLDSMDLNKDSNWANKPGKVLSTLLWPWGVNNSADLNKYKASLKALTRYNPQLAWEVLTNLLSKTMSYGTTKPKWRAWESKELERKLTSVEAVRRYEEIGRMLINMADNDCSRLVQLVDSLDNLIYSIFLEALVLFKRKLAHLTFETQDELWERLVSLSDKH